MATLFLWKGSREARNLWPAEHQSVVGLRFLLSLPTGTEFPTLCGLYVFTDVVGALVVMQFWTFAGDIFAPREARRLFGVIAGGSTLSNLLFGTTLGAAAEHIEPAQRAYRTVTQPIPVLDPGQSNDETSFGIIVQMFSGLVEL